jgi:hypothetical protein
LLVFGSVSKKRGYHASYHVFLPSDVLFTRS